MVRKGGTSMSDDPIRRAASRWLRENEAHARVLVDSAATVDQIREVMGWSDVQINNMLTYLALVEGEAA
jgi:hypothetical protein